MLEHTRNNLATSLAGMPDGVSIDNDLPNVAQGKVLATYSGNKSEYFIHSR
jgi:hypothetical protein